MMLSSDLYYIWDLTMVIEKALEYSFLDNGLFFFKLLDLLFLFTF